MKIKSFTIFSFILLTLNMGIANGSPTANIALILDSQSEIAGTIFPPGEHLLRVSLYNSGVDVIEKGTLALSLQKLHEGRIWNASLTTQPLDSGHTSDYNISLGIEEPGLYTLVIELKSDILIASATHDVSIGYTQDPWQNWRTKSEIPNKTHLFLSFYYPWYGTPDGSVGQWMHWVPQREYDSTHVPLIGFYDSLSEDVIRYHVRIAQSVGFDGFISSWWGPGNYIDDAFPKLLDIASETDFEASIYLEIASDRNDLYNQLHYVLSRYGNHPAFLRWEGKPVIFIYGRVMGYFELTEFAGVFDELQDQGLPAFYLADRLSTKYLDVFDGLHAYSPLSAMNTYTELTKKCTEMGKIFAATIAPGYDDTVIRDPGLVVDRRNGTYYHDSWEIIMLTKPHWVLVTSWNEWHEGSEIEPSLEFGDL